MNHRDAVMAMCSAKNDRYSNTIIAIVDYFDRVVEGLHQEGLLDDSDKMLKMRDTVIILAFREITKDIKINKEMI